MSDLHIHIFEDITEEDLKAFFSKSIGSKYFDPKVSYKDWDIAFQRISQTPEIWIGEISLIAGKAGKSNYMRVYSPKTVEKIRELIGEKLPLLDEKLIKKIIDDFDLENFGDKIAKKNDVEKFLLKYKGKRIFTVTW